MAQAVFHQHPLEDYLSDVGEPHQLNMPGIAHDFTQPSLTVWRLDSVEHLLPQFAIHAIELARRILPSIHSFSSSSAQHASFAERFKYDVISSSLLSSSLSSTPLPRAASPSLPGRLVCSNSSSRTHSRLNSREQSPRSAAARLMREPPGHHAVAALYRWPETVAFAVTLAAFGAGHYWLAATAAVVTIGGMSWYLHTASADVKLDTTPCVDALNDLISAGNEWDSVIHEAITTLEKEERNIFYGPSSPSSPSSSIRVALHSSLHDTQTQCDNVRHLLSALTAPSELSQLAEMYAPPAPMHHSSRSFNATSTTPQQQQRPLSHPGSRRRNDAARASVVIIAAGTGGGVMQDKRSTWNGPWSAGASSSSPTSPTMHLFGRRRSRRRPDMSTLLGASPVRSESEPASPMATPSAPVDAAQPLSDAQEDAEGEKKKEEEEEEPEAPQFGIAALDLQRSRRSAGLELLFPSSSSPAPSVGSPGGGGGGRGGIPWSPSPLSSASSSSAAGAASRFTTLQTTRHPLSLSALHHALQGALAAKRYACAHLLALRFDEEEGEGGEGEGYWEDVRSVVGLLAGAMRDAAARLGGALDEAAKTRMQEGTPSTEGEGESGERDHGDALRVGDEATSFAPVPTHVARFAAHVEVIATALGDARACLEACVSGVKDVGAVVAVESPPPPPPVQAYERLRRELGLALRECERAREPLLDIVSPRAVPSALDLSDHEGEEEEEDMPGLGPDVGSDESDTMLASLFSSSPSDDRVVALAAEPDADDATRYLLAGASSAHLPLPGIEQVFEADMGPGAPGAVMRERAKASREERIRLARERRCEEQQRQSGGGGDAGRTTQGWGPGGEVVQELKDVIWKVGERRRRLAEAAAEGGVMSSS